MNDFSRELDLISERLEVLLSLYSVHDDVFQDKLCDLERDLIEVQLRFCREKYI